MRELHWVAEIASVLVDGDEASRIITDEAMFYLARQDEGVLSNLVDRKRKKGHTLRITTKSSEGVMYAPKTEYLIETR
jgi:hypothetical protein